MTQVAPENHDMNREPISPIVFYDEYSYCCGGYCYCCPCAAELIPGCCIPGLCCFSDPDKTLAYAAAFNAKAGMFGDDKALLTYKFMHKPPGIVAVEIFRNAKAVDDYHRYSPKSGCTPGLPACSMISLACRENFGVQKVYGSEEECKKVAFDFGRTAKTLKKGKLEPLPGSGTMADLAAQFGAFHFGWVDDKKGAPVPSMVPPPSMAPPSMVP